jgi:thiol-disulfide isomerase/thioredoxin
MPPPGPLRRQLLRALPAALAIPALAAPARAQQPSAAAPGVSNGTDGPVAWPPIELLDGSVWSPESWRRQAGVLLIWATWCPFCARQNPHVDALHRAAQAAGRPLRVLAASLDRDPELVRRYVRERGYAFPVTMGAEALRARFGLRRVTPTTVTFDRRRRLLQRIPGEMFEEDVMALIGLADTPG